MRMRPWIVLFVLILSIVADRAVAGLPGTWVSQPFPVGGRVVQEVRLGASAGDRDMVIGVLINGPTSGTTTLLAGQIQMLALLNGALPTFLTLVAAGNAFSLGGPCEVGGVKIMPYVREFRPNAIRFSVGAPIAAALPVAGTDLYTAIDCTNVGDTAYFALLNHTQSRIEMYVEDGDGFRSRNAGFANVLSTFAGGVRPAIAGSSDDMFAITYQQQNGSVRLVNVFASTKLIESNCQLHLVSPPPSTFERVKEMLVFPSAFTGIGMQRRFGAVGDFNLNGTNELTSFLAGGACVPTTVAAGTAAGVSPHDWLATVGIGHPTRDSAYFGNGDAFWKLHFDTGLTTELANPPVLAGGPVHGLGVWDNDSGRFGLLVVGVAPEDPARLRVAYNPTPWNPGSPRLLRSGFDLTGPGTAVGYGY